MSFLVRSSIKVFNSIERLFCSLFILCPFFFCFFGNLFSGDEMFSDSYPMKLVDDLYYEVEGKVLIFDGALTV